MDIFKDYFNEAKEYYKNNKKEMIKIIPTNNVNLNDNVLLATVNDIPNMDDNKLRKFISNSYHKIINSIGKSPEFIRCFMDPRFLDIFIDILNDMVKNREFFNHDDIVKLNTVCYDYIRLDGNKDQNITNRMLRMASIINGDYLPRILGLGLNANLANMILIARFSSIDLNVCIKRVDFIIINQPKELMNQEMIENIFRSIYNILNDYHLIFGYIMHDVVPDNCDGSSEKCQWVTDEIQEVDSVLSLAALNILENLPYVNIRVVLLNYAETHNIMRKNDPIRFSMRRLSEEYPRINDTIMKLQYNENIIVP